VIALRELTMLISIPQRHLKYIQMLVQAKFVANEERAKTWAFEEGLEDVESDLSIGATEPDMELSVLRGKQVTIEVTDKPGYHHRLDVISKGYRVAPAKAASIVFLLGLFLQYLLLKDSTAYQEDSRFRKMVDRMPHDVCFDLEDMQEGTED